MKPSELVINAPVLYMGKMRRIMSIVTKDTGIQVVLSGGHPSIVSPDMIDKIPEPQMVHWEGNNLREVVEFTGKSPKFDEWFKTWEEYEQYVRSHAYIFKLFNEQGGHLEVPLGAWIVKTPDGYNVPSRFIVKPEWWTEEDEKMRHEAIQEVEYALMDKELNYSGQEPVLRWLKGLDVSPSALSKYKEAMRAADKFEEGYDAGIYDTMAKAWKPNEEQMTILSDLLEETTGKKHEVLLGLYQQLKQL